MEKYTVQVLSDKEFDSLPYDGIKDSHGFADVKKGLAFVRNSGNKEFDLGTIAHEVNHLIEKHGAEHPDYESGILHKKGGFLKNILPTVLGGLAYLVPGIGPILGPVVGAASNIGMDQYAKSNHPTELGQPGQFGDILGAGALGGLSGYGAGNAIKGGIAGGTNAAEGFLSKGAGILKGAAVGTAPSAGVAGTSGAIGSGGNLLGIGTNSLAPLSVPSGTSALSSSVLAPGQSAARAASSVGGSLSTVPQSSLNLLGGVNAYNPVNSAAPGMSLATPPMSINPTSTPAMSLPNGGVGNVSGTPLLGSTTIPSTLNAATGGAITPTASLGASNAPAAATKQAFSFKDLVTPSNVLGAGSLLGSVATPSPQFQMPDSVEQLRSKILQGNGLSPLGQQAQGSLQEILSSTPSQLNAPANDAYYADTNRRIDQQYDQAKKQLDSVYNNAGMLGSGEYLDQVRKLTQAQADAKDAFVQSENQRRFEFGSNQKYQAIQQALGVDQNTMNDLVGLTGLDVQTAAMMYGAKAADVTAIRTALGTLGAQALLQGQGIKTQPNVSVTLGK